MAISEKVSKLIESELDALEREIEHRLEHEYEQTFENMANELFKYDWLELPDYNLMQFQKDAINRAIEAVLSNEMEMF